MRLMTNDTYHLINYRDGFDLYLHLYIKLRPMLEDRFKLYWSADWQGHMTTSHIVHNGS